MPFFTTKTFLTFAVCIELAAAFHGLEVDLLCEQCNSSFFCTGGNRFECPARSLAHSWPADNVTSCTCNNGFLATPARDACGVGTPPFYYEAGIAKLCTGGLRQTVRAQADSGYACVCPPGYYGPPGLGACTKCQPGFYTEDFNTSECTACALFSHADEGADNRSDCMCNPGYTGPDSGPCEACPPGTFKESRGSAACTQCDVDTFAAHAAAECTPCRDNSSAVAGSASEEACLCNPGFHQENERCTQCEEGRSKDWIGNAPCTLCATGNYSATLGAVYCLVCLDSSQSSPADGGTKCVCSAGFFHLDSTSVRPPCQPCAPDTYQHLTGSTSCASCPAHATSPAASPAIDACICDPGMFDVGTGECAACAPGSHKERAADDDGDVAACVACSENKTSVQGSSSIEQCVCKRGFFGVGGCLACAAGAFKNTTGSAFCTPCPVGTVSLHDPVHGTVACTPCAEVLNSPFAITRREGGGTADACVCNASLGSGDRDFVPGETEGCAPCGPGTISRYEDPEDYGEPSSVCVDCLQGQYTVTKSQN